MSEKELNSYRFLSGEDPSDEMLECIMREMAEYAMMRRKSAEDRIRKEVEQERAALRSHWALRLKSVSNA